MGTLQITSILLVFTSLTCVWSIEDVYTTKVFFMEIEPASFNWTMGLQSKKGYWFRASLAGCPDLPAWLSYAYNGKLQTGYLYGVPPAGPPNAYKVEIVGMNRDNFETRVRMVTLNIVNKPDAAKFEVHLKIDNLNVEDMLEGRRLDDLMRVVSRVLWPQSSADIYPTFVASAVDLGARLPLSPNESDGVVVRLGSRVEFSDELLSLQEETRPLWKIHSCPRDFKRTTVDRHFRPAGFVLDWCSFRLGKRKSEAGNTVFPHTEPSGEEEGFRGPWQLPSRHRLPSRSYTSDLVATLVLPVTVLVLLAVLLSLVLCFHHEGITDPPSDEFFDSLIFCDLLCRSKHVEENEATLNQYEAVQRATNSLRSMSNVRDTETNPRMMNDLQDGAMRPNPPPYTATLRIARPDS